jgi:hypothetical protein
LFSIVLGLIRLATTYSAVVAGAKVLEMLAQEKASDVLVEYLGSHVLWLADDHEPVAGVGMCYERRPR